MLSGAKHLLFERFETLRFALNDTAPFSVITMKSERFLRSLETQGDKGFDFSDVSIWNLPPPNQSRYIQVNYETGRDPPSRILEVISGRWR